MSRETRKSVLIIDDQKKFADALATALSREQYKVNTANSVDEALLAVKSLTPSFILADRLMEGEAIETRDLERLAATANGALIIIYTRVSELTQEDIWRIQSHGAIRVIEKKQADRLVRDIKLLTQEFDELANIADELDSATRERSKLVAALVGSEVGVSVIDSHFHCWFVNSVLERIVGQACSGNLCWTQLHGHAAESGACWNCTVKDVLATGRPASGLFLNRYANGSVKWVDILSTPFYLPDTKKVIAVREGVTEASDEIIRSCPPDQRLTKIAQGLVGAGFGRARIYQIQSEVAVLKAAASISDNPSDAVGKYMLSLSGTTLNYNRCPHINDALTKLPGLFVPEWEPSLGPSPFAEQLELKLPYFIVPVHFSDGTLCGFVCIDLVGVRVKTFEPAEPRNAKKTLNWLQEYFAAEIRKAREAEHGLVERQYFDIVQRARIRVGTAQSVEAATNALRDAFTAMFPNARISTRRLTPEGLKEYEKLCVGKRPDFIPELIGLEDPRSLAAFVVKKTLPVWLDDTQEHNERHPDNHIPTGYGDRSVRSSAHLPLMIEGNVVGSLSFDSAKPVRWKEDGLDHPIMELSKLVALVIRDIALYDDLAQKSADVAALIAYVITVSGDALWIHWARQRLTEASILIYECRKSLKNYDVRTLEAKFLELQGIIETVAQKRPPSPPEKDCSLHDVMLGIQRRYEQSKIPLSISDIPVDLPRVRVPKTEAQHILEILIDNAFKAIETSGVGTKVAVAIRKGDDHFVEIAVEDDGPGLSTLQHEQLFKERMPSDPGHGVGLLVARGTALQSGGDLELGRTKVGATFILRLKTA